jgi:hypothetical protein
VARLQAEAKAYTVAELARIEAQREEALKADELARKA